jgi:hypothetical protein
MAESNGHLCPECGAPRAADNTPSCGCTQRASDALRDARTAQAAAAEDFDPLRIRPYVELEGEGGGGTPEGAAGATGSAGPEGPAEPSEPSEPLEPFGADVTMPLRPVAAELPTPLAPPAPEPSTRDLRLFDGAGPTAGPDGVGNDDFGGFSGFDGFDDEPRRPRRTLLLGAAGGLVAVIAAAGLASGFFSYESPTRDSALPEEVRASVPDASTSTASASPSRSAASASPTTTAPSAATSTSPSASPSPSRSSASPSASRSTGPTATQSASASASASGAAGNSDSARESTPPVLRRGSDGAEVVELELRLTQLNLYTREASGHYNEGVQDAVSRYQWARGIQVAEYGVYDLVTRERLESETQEP